jgi:hypothetical protein
MPGASVSLNGSALVDNKNIFIPPIGNSIWTIESATLIDACTYEYACVFAQEVVLKYRYLHQCGEL